MSPLFIICGAMGALASLVALFICTARRIPAKKSMLCVKGFSIIYVLGALFSGDSLYAFLALFGIVGFFVSLIALIVTIVMRTSKKKPLILMVLFFVFVIMVGMITPASSEVDDAPVTEIEHPVDVYAEAEERPEISECVHEWLPATCTTSMICSKCGAANGEPLGHSWNTVSRDEPTEESYGTEHMECTACGEKKTRTIPKLKHIVTFEEIYRAYKKNELTADDEYKDNRYEITAKIEGISSDGLLNWSGGATLTFSKRVDNTIVYLLAEFEKDQETALKKVSVGDTVTFEGTCLSYGFWEDCEIR